jgi:nicotinate-nucleotide pyrophosphorylase (carboxylating)
MTDGIMNEGATSPFLLTSILSLALREDLGHGDTTSLLTVPAALEACAHFIAKETLVIAGVPFVSQVFAALGSGTEVRQLVGEGAVASPGMVIAEASGQARALLAGERTALNILQRVSGVATLTRAYVERVSGLPVKIVDTRKTAPGMRIMEKYGVRTGGGANHRFGLFDGVLIKDNHVMIAGGVAAAVTRAKAAHHLLKIEVEVSSLEGIREAVAAKADVIMLDNMEVPLMKEAVALARQLDPRVLLEASGNVNLDSVREIAETGVDMVSVGALTHSARAVDISIKIVETYCAGCGHSHC